MNDDLSCKVNLIPDNELIVSDESDNAFALTEEQRLALMELWLWQEQSLRSTRILGGPIE